MPDPAKSAASDYAKALVARNGDVLDHSVGASSDTAKYIIWIVGVSSAGILLLLDNREYFEEGSRWVFSGAAIVSFMFSIWLSVSAQYRSLKFREMQRKQCHSINGLLLHFIVPEELDLSLPSNSWTADDYGARLADDCGLLPGEISELSPEDRKEAYLGWRLRELQRWSNLRREIDRIVADASGQVAAEREVEEGSKSEDWKNTRNECVSRCEDLISLRESVDKFSKWATASLGCGLSLVAAVPAQEYFPRLYLGIRGLIG